MHLGSPKFLFSILLLLGIVGCAGTAKQSDKKQETIPSIAEENQVISDRGPSSIPKYPNFTYLTWRRDDTSHMITVNYHSRWKFKKVLVHFGEEDEGVQIQNYPFKSRGTRTKIKYRPFRVLKTKFKRRVHRIDLNNLKPDTTYYFVVSNGVRALTEVKKFRTMPDDDRPLNFVVGGDTTPGSTVTNALFSQAALLNPMFIIFGGDIAYDSGDLKNYGEWEKWLHDYTTNMVTSDGHLIPMIIGIGNHEVDSGGYGATWKQAPFYRAYFAQEPKKSYYSRRFGSQTIFYLLDSGHIAPQGGAQAKWLNQKMAETAGIRDRFAVYHVPIYPSAARDNNKNDAHYDASKKNWLPLFDQYKLTAGFEHHEHTLKRTHPIRNGKIDEDGTVYFGDGSFGKGNRPLRTNTWYLANAAKTQHFWYVESSEHEIRYEAINSTGEVVDSYIMNR